MIRKRDPGHHGPFSSLLPPPCPQSFTDAIAGPLIVSTILFVAVLANFVVRGMYYSCGLFLD